MLPYILYSHIYSTCMACVGPNVFLWTMLLERFERPYRFIIWNTNDDCIDHAAVRDRAHPRSR
jgi:hypothetical protein